MSEDIRSLTAQLAADPTSLAFLELAELLRRRGQLDAALTVAANGLRRYPELADAHALHARILADRGDGENAFDSWMNALQIDPGHIASHKGLGFLYYRAGDLPRALRHLETAAGQAGPDAGLSAAIQRVQSEISGGEAPTAPRAEDRVSPPAMPFSLDAEENPAREDDLFAGLEGARDGLLLLDQHGMRIGGGLRDFEGADVSDAVAAHLAGVSREAARAARLLGLGAWESVGVECPDGNMHLVMPTADTVLLTVRDVSIPAGRLALLAERAAQATRQWLGEIA
jgi:tetratricopeptide (TPR) repeat protein